MPVSKFNFSKEEELGACNFAENKLLHKSFLGSLIIGEAEDLF